ncbi:MAG: radical SAM protein [archaeon]
MTLKITLAKPEVEFPVKMQGSGGDVGIPLGLLYLGAYARENGDVDVRIRDYRLERALGKPRNLQEDLADSDVVGVGACTVESPDALRILREAKTMGKATVMGGLFPTFNAEAVLSTGFVDFVVRGEGEKGLVGLLDALGGHKPLESVKGVSFREGDRIIHNPDADLIRDLDSLPMPAYDLIPVEQYAQFDSAPIYSARGCPMTCDFCTLNKMWGFKHRARSPEDIIAEIEMLKSFGFDRVHFKDETVTLNRENAMELFGEIERAGLGMSYKVKSRIDQIDEPLLQQMMRAGVDTIHTGIETLSQEAQRRMSKPISEATIRNAFDIMLGNGCDVNPVYLFGYGGETPAELETDARFIREIGSRPCVITYVSFMTPHPQDGVSADELEILTADLSRYNHKQPVAVPTSLDREGLKRMVDTYHEVTGEIGMRHVNPRVDPVYLGQILEKPAMETRGESELAA